VTRSLRRLFELVGRCVKHDEPVLLVGDTGCGKTSVVQLFALLLQTPLHSVSCHAHTEVADLLGGMRPARGARRHARALREEVLAAAALADEMLVAPVVREDAGAGAGTGAGADARTCAVPCAPRPRTLGTPLPPLTSARDPTRLDSLAAGRRC